MQKSAHINVHQDGFSEMEDICKEHMTSNQLTSKEEINYINGTNYISGASFMEWL